MIPKAQDFASQARVMAATAKCLEAMNPLTPDERRRLVFGLVIATLDENEPGQRRFVENLLAKMTEEVKR